MENTETKLQTAVKLEMPEVIYLREDYGSTIVMGGVEYHREYYCTTTFKTRLYKYAKA